MHFRNHVDAVDDQAGSLGCPQRRVQHSPVLCDVDVFAGQHRITALCQTHLASKINECTQNVGIDQVLGKIDIKTAGLNGSAANQPRRSGCRDSYRAVSLAQAGVVVGSTGWLIGFPFIVWLGTRSHY
jgi:hypothetical protein